MAYISIDTLQKVLANDVFSYAKDSKKAAGRALGTLVEIINFYLLKSWNYEKHTVIERRLPEYANPSIKHNVEFTLHPTEKIGRITLSDKDLPFTAKKIHKKLNQSLCTTHELKNMQLLSKSRLLRNACMIYEGERQLVLAYLENKFGGNWNVLIQKLLPQPFAMFECKRVGVEEGIKKGPQTIEKAKQGAYVAKSISSLQKIRMTDGSIYGALSTENDVLHLKPYEEFRQSIIDSNNQDLLRHFILTIGIVSNHGNWFTSDNHNKELEILAQSYDWLLFLTDQGLGKFVDDLLLNPVERYESVKKAFIQSYTGDKGKNRFTKVQISWEAHQSLQRYFQDNLEEVESWFNTISPVRLTIQDLKTHLQILASKNWKE